MARRRMIDPNIWESEDFNSLSDMERLLFIGMFSLADDEGRGRASSNYLKVKVFPYDDRTPDDIEQGINHIAEVMSVTIYMVGERRYYQLDHWDEWQTIQKPKPSKIPSPNTDTVSVQYEYSTDTVPVHDEYCLKEKKGKEEKRIEENISLFDGHLSADCGQMTADCEQQEREKREEEEAREKEEKKRTKRKEEKESQEGEEKKEREHTGQCQCSGMCESNTNITIQHTPSSLNDVIQYAQTLGITSTTTSEAFYDFFSSNGWKVSGKAPMKDWKAAFRNWVRNEQKYSRNFRNYEEHKPTDIKVNMVDLDAED